MDGPTDARCSQTNKDGSPCSAPVWRDQLCRWHHPDSAAAIAAGRRKGGRARSNAARAAKQLPAHALSVDQLRGVLGQTITRVIAGELEPAVGNAVAGLARAYVAVNEAAELERLAERVAELERLA